MKKATWTLIALIALALAASPALAMNHGGMKGEMKGDMKMDHSTHKGEGIHDSEVDGHKLSYHLIDNKEQMEKMKDMKGMKKMEGHDMSQMKSHHLMVFVMGPDGKMIEDAKAGYLVTGPGGEQKAMGMAMTGGYGADLELSEKGSYTIKTKVQAGDVTLKDSFTYEVK